MPSDAFEILTFDYGLRRTGVAIGQSVTGMAFPLAPLMMKDGQPDWVAMAELIRVRKPAGFLVGLPVHMDGTCSEMALRADKFRRRLHGRFGRPAVAWDERLTSQEIKRRARAAGVKDFGKHSVDGEAAVLVFESWFASLPGEADWREHTLPLPPWPES